MNAQQQWQDAMKNIINSKFNDRDIDMAKEAARAGCDTHENIVLGYYQSSTAWKTCALKPSLALFSVFLESPTFDQDIAKPIQSPIHGYFLHHLVHQINHFKDVGQIVSLALQKNIDPEHLKTFDDKILMACETQQGQKIMNIVNTLIDHGRAINDIRRLGEKNATIRHYIGDVYWEKLLEKQAHMERDHIASQLPHIHTISQSRKM